MTRMASARRVIPGMSKPVTKPHRLGSWLTRLFAFVTLIGFIGAVPLALRAIRPNPIPDQFPSLSRMVTLIKAGRIDSAVIPNTFTIVAWLAWGCLVLALVAELVGRLRGRSLHIPVISTGFGAISKRWIGALGLVAVTGLPSMAQATPLRDPAITNRPAVASAQSSVVSVALSGGVVRDAAAAVNTVTVEAGDSYWELAEQLHGDGFAWGELLKANEGRTMSDGHVIKLGDKLLRPGWELIVPASWDVDQANVLWRERIVVKGDTLWDISKDEFGQGTKWPIIERDNSDVVEDPNLIFPGETLRIRTSEHEASTLDQAIEATRRGPDTGSPADRDNTSSDVAPIAATVDATTPATTATATPATTAPPASTVAVETTAAPVPTPEANTAKVSVSADTGTARRGKQGVLITLVGVSTMLAAAGLWRLQRRRNADMVARKSGDPAIVPTAAAKRIERTYRSISEADQVEWLEEALCAVQASLTEFADKPRVVAMRAGAQGVEVVFDRAVAPKAPFEATNIDMPGDMHAWRLAPTIDYEDLRVVGDTWHGLVPFLVSPGDTADGPIFVGLDSVDRVGVFCQDSEMAVGAVKALGLQAAMLPWGEERQLIIVGADAASRSVFNFDHTRCVERLDDVTSILLSGAPTNIVLLDTFDMKALTELETQFRGQVTVIGVGLSGGIEVTVDASTQRGHVEPFGIQLAHVALAGPTQVDGLAQLLDTTTNIAEPMAGSSWDDLEPEHANHPEMATDSGWDDDDVFQSDDAGENEPGYGPHSADPAAESRVDVEACEPTAVLAVDRVASGVDWTQMWTSGNRSTETTSISNGDAEDDDPDDDPKGGPGRHASENGADSDGRDDEELPTAEGGLVGASMSAEMLTWLDEVMAPRDVEVSVLGDEPTVRRDGTRLRQAKVEEFVVLAALGPIGRDSAMVALSEGEMTRTAIRQLLFKARKATGEDSLLAGRDEIAVNPMLVGVDWMRFQRLVERAHDLKTGSPADAAVCLQRALQIPTGIGWKVLRGGGYEWAYERQLPYVMATAISDAACLLGQLAVEVLAQPKMAVWATTRGMIATTAPSLELVEWGLRGAVASGDVTEVARLEKALDSLAAEYDVELAPSTQALLAHIRRHVDGRRAPAAI